MTIKLKGRVIGARFKTFEGAAKRARAERFYEPGHTFHIEEETDPYQRARGYAFRIRKTKITK